MADYLTYADLVSRVGSERALRFFDDDNDGVLSSPELALVDDCLIAAEGQAYSVMLSAWPKAQVIQLAQNDALFKQHVAWVALEIASERRPEFCQPDGSGQFVMQYKRALDHFKALKQNGARSVGEAVAGRAGTAGGTVNPPAVANTPQFTFAPSRNNPSGSGGF